MAWSDTDPALQGLLSELMESEGFRPGIYDDHDGRDITDEVRALCTGTPTTAFGQTWPISREGAKALMAAELYVRIEELVNRAYNERGVDVRELPAPVRRSLFDMAYNLGVPRLLGFVKMFAALKERNLYTAAAEVMDSKYGRGRLRRRAERNAARMREAA